MDDERAPLAARSQRQLDLAERRRRKALALERNRQQAGGLVDDDERVVFVDDFEMGRGEGSGTPGGARTVGPDPNDITRGEEHGGVEDLRAVEEYLAAIEGGRRSATRAEPLHRREEFIEPRPRVCRADTPFAVRHSSVPPRLAYGLLGQSCRAEPHGLCRPRTGAHLVPPGLAADLS